MIRDDRFDVPEFSSGESSTALQSHGVDPELSFRSIPGDMNVRWLAGIRGEKKETMRADSQDRGHYDILAAQEGDALGRATPTFVKWNELPPRGPIVSS